MRHEHTADYECEEIMEPLVAALTSMAAPGEMVIWRKPFRWHNHDGVISNAYDGHPLESIAEMLGREIVFDFKHAAILAPKKL